MSNRLFIDLGQNARLSVSGPCLSGHLAGIFSHWSRPSQETADLCLALGPSGRSNAASTFTLTAEGSLRVHGAYKLVPWQAEVWSVANPWDIRFHASLYQEWLAARLVILPFLQRALLQQGRFLLPASVVRWGEQTLALIGPGGVGKTSLLLACCAAGAQFVGDDFVVVSAGGPLQGLGDTLSVKAAALAENAPLRARLTGRQRGWLRVCAALERLSRRGVTLSLHVSAQQLFGETTGPRTSQDAAQVVFIERTRGAATRKLCAKPDALGQVILLQLKFWEACFGDLIALQRTLRGQPTEYWETYTARLDDFMHRSQCWCLQTGLQRGWTRQALPLLLAG